MSQEQFEKLLHQFLTEGIVYEKAMQLAAALTDLPFGDVIRGGSEKEIKANSDTRQEKK